MAEGSKPIEAVFTAEQEEFLMTVAKRHIDFATLVVLGPLLAQRWRFEDPACPWPMTAELWRREDGQRLMEVSIKAPIVQAAAAIGGFMAYLAEVGAERDDSEQTKTRWALGHYAAKLQPTRAGEAPAGSQEGRLKRRRKAPLLHPSARAAAGMLGRRVRFVRLSHGAGHTPASTEGGSLPLNLRPSPASVRR